MREGRWTTVTESEFAHEQRGLARIQEQLPDAEPWRAWSNFTFTAHTGHVREVDLLVVTPGGIVLVELKDWHGTLESRNGSWLQTQPSGRVVSHGNPLHLANKKAKELASLLRQAGRPGEPAPWVAEAVCFTDSGLRFRLAPHDLNKVFMLGPGAALPDLVEHLRQPPRDERRRIDATRSRRIAALLEQVGIARSDAQFQVGPYRLERKAFDTGPTWADYLAQHNDLPKVARVRLYLRERGSDESLRKSVESAARREASVLSRFRHPGVVQLEQYDASAHAAGPALIFAYDPRTLRLDEYLAQYGDKLDILARVALVRQLAETIRSAHGRRLFHRSLAARAVHVMPRGRDNGDAGWLAPHLQVSDWQAAAARTSDSSGGGTNPTLTSFSGIHVSEAADPYLAPELTARDAKPVPLDVYGLGVLTYLLVTGRAPAASQAELLARLEAGEGLRPSAVVDGLSTDLDELVQAATAYRPGQRLATVDEFLEMLEVVEDGLTAPAQDTVPVAEPAEDETEPRVEKDPLESVAGDVVGERWEVLRRLGTGSTSRAFLVRDLNADPDDRRTKSLAVLKIALSDSRAQALHREAQVMGRLRPDSRIIRLLEPEPQVVAGRTMLVLEYVGNERAAEAIPGAAKERREETVARMLREHGRLTVDQLESYGDYLFGAVDFLEGEGVWHRDIKPDNIAVRVRPNRTRELVLIDFSLAGYPVSEVQAGTEGYLDPFIGGLTQRSVYDAHAERYALAVTLHEMASGELPTWGDSKVLARQTDPAEFPWPTLAAEAFDPAVREGLVEFFRKALHRDAAQRFPELKPMRDAWKRIFLALDQVRPSSRGRGSAAPAVDAQAEPPAETTDEEYDRLADAATRDTPIGLSGLRPAAVSFVHGLDITTVGDLLDLSQQQLVNRRGLGPKTRTEIQQRTKQWRLRLAELPASPLAPEGRQAAKQELSEAEAAMADQIVAAGAESVPGRALRTVSLDALVALLVPELKATGSNRDTVEVVRLLLRVPDEAGQLPDIPAWPLQKHVAQQVAFSAAQVSRLLKEQRTRWKKHAAVQAVRTEILELLAGLGRVASAGELADALAVRRGTRLQGRSLRRALALAVVRALVEVEQLEPATKAFTHTATRDPADHAHAGGLLALEVGEDDSPDTPSAPALLDYAVRLGRVADRLAGMDTLPTPGTVLTELGAITPPDGVVDWDERRMVELAAAASQRAAATPRLEIYPRDLPLVRALRLTQAGLVRMIPGLPDAEQPGLRPEEIHERVRARFPELVDARGSRSLPTGAPLTAALAQAGFDLTLSMRAGTRIERYLPKRSEAGTSSYVTVSPLRHSTRRPRLTRYADDPQLAGAVLAEERLTGAMQHDGFRVLTVRTTRLRGAVRELAGKRFGAQAVSVADLFIAALHEQLSPGRKPTWDTLLEADVAAPGTRNARNFAAYVKTAWGVVEPRIGEQITSAGTGPVLLVDGFMFARYDAMGVLERLADQARSGGRPLWLMCPQADPTREPRLGATVVPFQAGLGEWIVLPDSWVANAHRAGQETDTVKGVVK